MTILVTGGAGYIGSHTVKELRRNGFDVLVFDNFSSGKKDLIRTTPYVQGDLMDKPAVREAFRTR